MLVCYLVVYEGEEDDQLHLSAGLLAGFIGEGRGARTPDRKHARHWALSLRERRPARKRNQPENIGK